MLPCHCPAPLQPGDRLRVIAPSGVSRTGGLSSESPVWQGVHRWRSRGYEVEIMAGVEEQWGYLAGTDSHRRHQLLAALLDPDCRGILCGWGGYGGNRLLEDWQWPLVPPKWIIGFSDITALLWGLATQGISGVHGPLLSTLGLEPQWSVDRLIHWVEGIQPLPILTGEGWYNPSAPTHATGLLLPGNLAVATSILHTPIQPDLKNVILALEDELEPPYRLDRMLSQWRMTGALTGVRGIALGRFTRCHTSEPSLSVAEVLQDRLGDLSIPIVSGLPFGHDGPNAALPVGLMAHLDSRHGTLEILPLNAQ